MDVTSSISTFKFWKLFILNNQIVGTVWNEITMYRNLCFGWTFERWHLFEGCNMATIRRRKRLQMKNLKRCGTGCKAYTIYKQN